MKKCARKRVSISGVLLITTLCLFPILLTGCPDRKAPSAVTGLTTTAGDAQVVLAWTNPKDSDFNGVTIIRKVASTPANINDGTEVFKGLASTYTDTTAVNGTTYYYVVFAFDKSGNFSSGTPSNAATPTFSGALSEVIGGFEEINTEITGGGDPLPEEERGTLLTLLGDAESLYRQGLACEAGSQLLNGFLPKAQEFRTGSDIATAERLYNMGRTLRYDILSSLATKDECSGAERIGLPADAEANNESNSVSQLVSDAVFGEPRMGTVENPETGEVFTEIHLPDADTDMGEPGEPAVPMIRRLAAIPLGAKFEIVTPKPVVAETLQCNLAPAQLQPVDDITKPSDDVFANGTFVKNSDLYATDAAYPSETVKVTDLGSARDMRMLLIEIAGGQYNPATNTLSLFKNIPVEVKFTGGEYIGTEQANSLFEPATPIYTGAVLNGKLFQNAKLLEPIKNRFELTGEEFMILTHPNFREAADKLAAWKREKGITTRVFECGTDSGIGGLENKYEIDDFIEGHYSYVQIRPSYILLLGDADYIEPYYINNIGTDWPYATLGTAETDVTPDFALGRIPVDTLQQANAVVDKIIAYEKTPPNSSTFYRTAAVASQFQCCRDDVAWAGTDWRTFIEVSEFSRNVMLGKGKDVTRIYTKTGPSTTPSRYFDGAFLPTALGSGSGFAWDGSTEDITAEINAGRFLVIHRDHGWEYGWCHPVWETDSVASLLNGAFTPVVFSVNCASGYFDNETVTGGYPSSVYFVEQLLRKANGGAVGVLGDTRNSPSWPNTALLKGFMDAMWPSAIGSFGANTSKRRLGDILNHGKLFMMSQIGVGGAGVSAEDARNELYLWHCFGDPTMEIWLSYPYAYTLPSILNSVVFLNGLLNVGYDTDGAVITAWQNDFSNSDIQRVIGRGVVTDGVASFAYVQSPDPSYGINYSATFENAISVTPSL